MLTIDPNTPKGEAQLEALGWAQVQMNKALEQYFSGKHRIQKGIRVEFRLPKDLQMNEMIKIDISSLEPTTEEGYEIAIAEAKGNLVLKPTLSKVIRPDHLK